MSIKLNYSKKSINKISSNLVLFCDEKYKTIGLKKYVSSSLAFIFCCLISRFTYEIICVNKTKKHIPLNDRFDEI